MSTSVDEAPDEPVAPTGGRSGAVTAAIAVVALAVGLAAGLLLGGSLLRPAFPAEGSADVGFARDMQVHHGQAVEMSVLVRDRTDDDDVRQLALDILLTQQQQQGQMFGWLDLWGLPQASSAPAMAWMGDGHGHDEAEPAAEHDAGGQDAPMIMPGLITEEQMAALAAAEGVEAERLYLALMIPHHEGAVEMAEAALAHADQPVVRQLAEGTILAQQREIEVLERMLEERGGPPPGL